MTGAAAEAAPQLDLVLDLSEVDTDHYTAPPVFDQWQTRPPGLLLRHVHEGG